MREQRARSRVATGAAPADGTVGKATLTQRHVDASARHGLAAPGGPLPHQDAIQRSFGHHDVGGVTAHRGEAAREAAGALGAHAYATGDHVVLGDESPSLFLVAHEAAHTVQQRGGVQLSGGIDQPGDRHERHADAVAERVVRGESAEALLDEYAGGHGAGGGVQRAECADGSSAEVCPEGEDPKQLLESVRDTMKTITNLGKRGRGWIEASETYLTRNLGLFAGYTSGAPQLGFGRTDAIDLVQSFVVNRIDGEAAEAVGAAAAVAIGGAVGGPAGAAIGYVVELVIEKAVSYLVETVTGKTKESEAAAAAHIAGAAAATREALAVKVSFREARKKVQALEEQLEAELDVAETSADCMAIRDDALAAISRIPPEPADDDALFRRLLTEWVMENAGDDSDAAEGIDEAQWEAAKAEVSTEVDAEKQQLYVYQTRRHWTAAGIPFEETGIIETLLADTEMNADRKPGWTFTSVEKWRFADLVEAQTGDADFAQAIRDLSGTPDTDDGELTVRCRLDLARGTGKAGSVFIDEWEYEVVLAEAPVDWEIAGVRKMGDRKKSFTVSPD